MNKVGGKKLAFATKYCVHLTTPLVTIFLVFFTFHLKLQNASLPKIITMQQMVKSQFSVLVENLSSLMNYSHLVNFETIF